MKNDLQRRGYADLGSACKIKIGTKTWTESELEAASQTQSSWANAELDFKTWYDVSFRTCPSLNLRDFEPFISLENFINLQNVETVGYCDPKYRTPHPGRADWMEALWELSLGDEDYRDVFEMNPNRCLEMFCLHLERSRKDISSLRVTNIGEILYSPGKGLNLANLSTLTIDLAEEANYSYDESQIYGMHEHTGRFSDWFKSAAPRLRNLTIIQRWITKKRIVWRHFRFGAIIERIEPALDILDLFVTENMTFPMLQTLCLQHVTTTTLSLTKFLNFHRETLVHLKIDRPCIDRDDRKNWNEMRQKIGQEVEQGCFGSESGCETILTDAMTDPLGIDKDWRPFDNYE